MILNNRQVGKENISKIIEFGKGDINVGVFRNREEKYVGISFENRSVSEIGTKSIDVGLTTDEVTPDTMLTFFKEESIDVVIEKLKVAKIQFRNL
tara:strand:+ start:145 stop:429 length:285 start_codon:yes stop_codon:yes gene_type:complete